MNPNGEDREGTEDPGFTSTSDYAKNKTLLVYRGIFKGWANVSKSTLLPLVKTALRGATVTFPSPFRHSVSLTIAASASTLNTNFLRAGFHVLVLYRVCWTDHAAHKRQKLSTQSQTEKNGAICIQPLKIHWCHINGLRKNKENTQGQRVDRADSFFHTSHNSEPFKWQSLLCFPYHVIIFVFPKGVWWSYDT